jgi:RNA polymerase sigma-70 factor (ECF subfamily)
LKYLVQKAQAGDTEAFVRLLEIHHASMVKIARSYFSQQFDIDDILQDTAIACWINLPTLKKPQFFKTWLIRILINQCNAEIKKHPQTLPIEEAEKIGSQTYDPNCMDFDNVIELLDQKYRIVLTLYYNIGFNTSEIANILNIPTETVKTRMKRGREQLYKRLKGGENQ